MNRNRCHGHRRRMMARARSQGVLMPKRICPHCGNVIPDWANGVCYRCAMIEEEEKRFGPQGPHPGRDRESPAKGCANQLGMPRSEPEPRSTTRVARGRLNSTKPKIAHPGFRVRLEGFNALLEDVYGRPVRISHILLRRGASAEQVTLWRQDALWLITFLDKLEAHLAVLLEQGLPGYDARLLRDWYGFGRTMPIQAANTLRANPSACVDCRRMLAFLRGPAGKAALEGAVVASAREADVRSSL